MTYQLTDEERDLLDALETDILIGVENEETEKKQAKQIAINTLSRKKAISIRISEVDLRQVKIRALQEGMPYQTLITSVLHRYLRDGSLSTRR